MNASLQMSFKRTKTVTDKGVDTKDSSTYFQDRDSLPGKGTSLLQVPIDR